MLLKNIEYMDSSFKKVKGDIGIKDGKFDFSHKDTDSADMEGLLALPGFVDIHSHGGSGFDFCDASQKSLDGLSKHYAKHGVTSVCPTTMTLPKELLIKIFAEIESFKSKEQGAYFHGINMEGPFISKTKCGAQDPKYVLSPDTEFFRELDSVSEIALTDVAPESDGAFVFAENNKDRAVISIAHTDADYETAKKAIESGFSHATHFMNAMTPFTSRAPGVVGAVMESDTVTAEIICDGYHLSPATLRILFKTIGDGRLVVISDSMSSADCEDSEYTLGGQKVIVSGGKAHLENGTIAGSTTNIYEEFRNLLSFGIPFESALKCCTINPARVIGADKVCGSIEQGKNADLVIVDKELNIRYVMIKGKFFDLNR